MLTLGARHDTQQMESDLFLLRVRDYTAEPHCTPHMHSLSYIVTFVINGLISVASCADYNHIGSPETLMQATHVASLTISYYKVMDACTTFPTDCEGARRQQMSRCSANKSVNRVLNG